MKYTEFVTEVHERVQNFYGEKCIVTVQKALKNNAVELTGLVIKKAGENAAPVIYLEDLYLNFLKGEKIEKIVREIIEADELARFNFRFSLPKLEDVNQIKDKIVCKIINTCRNSNALDEIPHRDILDFSLVYYGIIANELNVNATFLIYNQHMEMWGIDEQELYELAMKNTFKILPPRIIEIEQLLLELINDENCSDGTRCEIREQLDKRCSVPMYVLTNTNRLYGAVCMLSDDILREFADREGDFYILPSSIHEVILIPDNNKISRFRLGDIVKHVNETQIPADEILSDSVYFYSHSDKKISQLNIIKSETDYAQ